MTQFIEENIGTMNVDAIAHEVSRELSECESMMDHDSAHVSEAMVKEHILSHTLNPVIKVGIMLRGLFDLDDKMKRDLYKVDAQGQNLGLDPKMIDAYLRLQNQMINVYKSDPSKLPYYKLNNRAPSAEQNARVTAS